MEGREKPHTDKYKGITKSWNYDATCTLMSLPMSGLRNFKPLIFITQCVHSVVGEIILPQRK
jgi:hypothetical protein